MKRIYAIFDKINSFFALIAMGLLVFLMLVVSLQVIMRHFFNSPIPWVLEGSQFCLVFVTYLGAAWVLTRDGHVRIEIIVRRFSHRLQAIINAIVSIVCATACLVVTVFGIMVAVDYASINYVYPGSLELPAWPLEAVVPLGFFMLFWGFVFRTIESFKAYTGKEHLLPASLLSQQPTMED